MADSAAAAAASTSLSPLMQSLLRIVPIVTTCPVAMAHFDQHLIFSSFLSSSKRSRSLPPSVPPPPPPDDNNSLRVASRVMDHYVAGVLPLVICLEFTSYGVLAANVYYRLPLYRWYAFGLACSLSHLANTPYAWGLLTAIRRGDGERQGMGGGREDGKEKEKKKKEEEGKRETRTALEAFVWMNKLRMVLSEIPLIAIVLAGALSS